MSLVATLKTKVPWWAKIGTKLVLSRLPISYKVWRRLAMFELGQMEQPAYAYRVFRRHFDRLGAAKYPHGFTVLELGPGDSLFSAMVAHALGASATYLVDVGSFAQSDLAPYHAMARFLQEQGLTTVNMDHAHSLDELLRLCHAFYATSGISSLRAIPEQSVDFIWSQDVLEHIKREDFMTIVRELRRVIHPQGLCSHRIDLKDHLGGALNNLRFPTGIWESEFMASGGFYTNRLRYSEILDLFKQAAFDVEVVDIERWPRVPTPGAKLAAEFRRMSPEELCVSGFDVILRPR
ncbi:MAG TPA: class I SAM-dependent methyltransferase [Nitrospirales bacterium]|jgi:SAM-dependent methyltransferase